MNSTEIARVKRRFQKKHKTNNRPLYMIAKEDLRSVRIIGVNSIHATDLPEGVHEVRLIPNPDPKKRTKDNRWVVTFYNKHLIGAAKNYFKNLSRAGIVEFYVGKN